MASYFPQVESDFTFNTESFKLPNTLEMVSSENWKESYGYRVNKNKWVVPVIIAVVLIVLITLSILAYVYRARLFGKNNTTSESTTEGFVPVSEKDKKRYTYK